MNWKPTKKTIRSITGGTCIKKRFKAFRSSSSAYISKKSVRDFIFNRDKFCVICKSIEKLEVDHILSVHYLFSISEFYKCNSIENLQLLCKKCNASKKV